MKRSEKNHDYEALVFYNMRDRFNGYEPTKDREKSPFTNFGPFRPVPKWRPVDTITGLPTWAEEYRQWEGDSNANINELEDEIKYLLPHWHSMYLHKCKTAGLTPIKGYYQAASFYSGDFRGMLHPDELDDPELPTWIRVADLGKVTGGSFCYSSYSFAMLLYSGDIYFFKGQNLHGCAEPIPLEEGAIRTQYGQYLSRTTIDNKKDAEEGCKVARYKGLKNDLVKAAGVLRRGYVPRV